MGNIPEKDKVYLVGTDPELVKKILSIFSDNFIRVNHIEWQELLRYDDGFFIMLSIPNSTVIKERLIYLMEKGNFVICICKDLDFNMSGNEDILKLPYSTSTSILKTLIPWIYKKYHRMNLEKVLRPDSESLDLINANKDLKRYAIQLETALDELNKKNLQLKGDLTLASDVQKSLLPKDIPSDLPINFSLKYLPYKYIGGDFFDIKRLSRDKLGIIISDVSGHGVAAALITAMVKSVFNQCAPGNFSPASTLSELNRILGETIHTDHYVTAFYSIFDLKKMELTYSNAGHPRQLCVDMDGKISELGTKGFFIGMFKNTEFEEKKISIRPGDRFFFFTDGMIEIQDKYDNQFGKDGLKKILNDKPFLDIESISSNILTELMMFMKETTFPDDITLLIAEIMEDL
ncbi:MAG: serine/threonine-protein phosphatase [Spirochaetales bacterium]|nr:serine/threonine-protein phosphatase [Spirochaetales bacterium]